MDKEKTEENVLLMLSFLPKMSAYMGSLKITKATDVVVNKRVMLSRLILLYMYIFSNYLPLRNYLV